MTSGIGAAAFTVNVRPPLEDWIGPTFTAGPAAWFTGIRDPWGTADSLKASWICVTLVGWINPVAGEDCSRAGCAEALAGKNTSKAAARSPARRARTPGSRLRMRDGFNAEVRRRAG